MWPLIVGLPLIVALAVAAVVLSGGGQETPQRSPEQASGGGDAGNEAGAQLGTPSLGSEDAPVVLTEYSDYQ